MPSATRFWSCFSRVSRSDSACSLSFFNPFTLRLSCSSVLSILSSFSTAAVSFSRSTPSSPPSAPSTSDTALGSFEGAGRRFLAFSLPSPSLSDPAAAPAAPAASAVRSCCLVSNAWKSLRRAGKRSRYLSWQSFPAWRVSVLLSERHCLIAISIACVGETVSRTIVTSPLLRRASVHTSRMMRSASPAWRRSLELATWASAMGSMIARRMRSACISLAMLFTHASADATITGFARVVALSASGSTHSEQNVSNTFTWSAAAAAAARSVAKSLASLTTWLRSSENRCGIWSDRSLARSPLENASEVMAPPRIIPRSRRSAMARVFQGWFLLRCAAICFSSDAILVSLAMRTSVTSGRSSSRSSFSPLPFSSLPFPPPFFTGELSCSRAAAGGVSCSRAAAGGAGDSVAPSSRMAPSAPTNLLGTSTSLSPSPPSFPSPPSDFSSSSAGSAGAACSGAASSPPALLTSTGGVSPSPPSFSSPPSDCLSCGGGSAGAACSGAACASPASASAPPSPAAVSPAAATSSWAGAAATGASDDSTGASAPAAVSPAAASSS
ncbi:hypothetical protein T484DRAFT_1925314 [Baffinella frigidus]|nr:hypothetical protein T484DRAFT_1925314 [Cryptophyta sp. CCMP2293]